MIKNPDLMFLVYAFEDDHVQSAPDKPHIDIQYHDFINAGIRFARINPDRSYVETMTGRIEPQIKDNPGNHVYTHLNIRDAMNPNRIRGKSLNDEISVASVCEMADRYYYDDTSDQLDQSLTHVSNYSTLHPQSPVLFPNYPNPFNQSSVIRYQLSANSWVALNIFDVNGRLVDNLVNQYQTQGLYEIQYDATGIPSGVYLIQLNNAQLNLSQRMILVR